MNKSFGRNLFLALTACTVSLACLATSIFSPTGNPKSNMGGGGLIAYASVKDDNTSEIRIFNVETGEDSLLFYDNTFKFWFSWSSDNRSIYFQSGFHAPRNNISSIDIDGKNLQIIVYDPAFFSWEPNISPDGKKIAFCTDRNGESVIYSMDTGGPLVLAITDFRSWGPQWSPDGKKIVFYSDISGNFEIYKIDADGTNLVQLTDNPARDSDPKWSPDGLLISFQSDRNNDNEKSDVFIMNADGTGVTDLTNNSAYDENASWSPDGRYLVFDSDRNGNFQLYTIAIKDPIALPAPTHSKTAISPAWSH